MMKDQELIHALLGELRYVLDTGDIRDSEKNSADIRRQAAKRLGFADYYDYCAGVDDYQPPTSPQKSD